MARRLQPNMPSPSHYTPSLTNQPATIGGTRSLSHSADSLEKSLTLLVLYLATSAWIPGFTSPNMEFGRRVILVRILGFGVAAFLVVWNYKCILHNLRRTTPSLLLVAYAVLSSLWSYNTRASIQDSLVLIGMSSFALYLGSRYSVRALVDLLATLFTIIAVFSILAVVLPSLEGRTFTGAWRGVTEDKNIFGALMALGSIVWVVKIYAGYTDRFIACVGLSSLVGLTVLSASATSLVMALLLILFLVTIHTVRQLRGLGALLISVGGFVGAALAMWHNVLLPPFFTLLGRDMTFTGRTELWQFGLEVARDHYWIGYGLARVWGMDGVFEYEVLMSRVGWIAQHAHNGFIDLWIHLGLVGVLLFSTTLLQILPKALKVASTSKGYELFLPLFLLYFLAFNMVESALIVHFQFLWIIYLAVYVQLLSTSYHPAVRRNTIILGATDSPRAKEED